MPRQRTVLPIEKKARHCRALNSIEQESLPGRFAEPSKSSQEERADTTQRKNSRFGHSTDLGSEIGRGRSVIDLHQTPTRAVVLPEVIKTGPRGNGRAIQQQTPGLTRGKV